MLNLFIRLGALLVVSAAMLLASTGVQARTTREGVLQIVWGDPHPELGSGGKTLYALAQTDGTILPLQLQGQESVAAYYFGQRVSVSGQQAPDALPSADGVSAAPLVVDSIALASNAQNRISPALVSGTKKVIYLLLKFSDDAAVPHPPTFYTNLNNPDTPPGGELFPATVNGFFKKTSEGLFSWVGDVGGQGGLGAPGGWLTLPGTKASYANCGWSGSCANLGAIATDGTALGRAQGIDFKLYDNINFVISNDLDCCAWGGGWYSSVDAKSYGATWEPPWGQEAGTYAHEMGHSLGLPHSGWVYSAYDSPWDMMSDRGQAQNPACGSYLSKNSAATRTLYCSEPGNEYIAAYKDYLGWIPLANVITTSNISSVSTTLESNSLPSSAFTKMLKICISGSPCTGSSAHYFTVEARSGGAGATSQFDNGLPGSGVIIHEFMGNRPAVSGTCFFNSQSGWAWPMDSSPNDWDLVNCNEGGRVYPNYGLYNAQWVPGQTYTNATYNFRVAVLSQSGSKFDVSLSPLGTSTGDITPVLFLLLFD